MANEKSLVYLYNAIGLKFLEVILQMKVLLIDDHSLFIDGMNLVLVKLDPNIQVFNANSYEDALPLMNEHSDLDLVLLDLGLPGLSDIDALKAVRNELPATPVVVLSSNDDGAKVQQILNLGAQGYIPKSTNTDVLIRSLKLVLSGGIYIPPEILSQLDQNTNRRSGDTAEDSSYARRASDKITETPFTPRQHEVLGKLVHGYSNKEIGELLKMAESTVRVHIAAILKELNVSNRTRAAHLAVQKGWITVGQEE